MITFTTGSTAGNATERLRIASDGDVFIGNSNLGTNNGSTAKLEVIGTLNNSYPQYSYPIMVSDDAAYNSSAGPGGGIGFAFKQNSGGSYAQAGGIRGIKENTTDGNYASALTFYTRPNGAGTEERVRIDSSGNLLVNSDSTGGTTFHSSSYSGSLQVHDASLVLSKVGTGTRNWRFVNNNIAAGNFGIQCSTSDNGGTSYSNVVEFNKNGNVCVGNGNPTTARLEVRDNSSNNYGTTIRLSQGYNSVFSEIATNFGGSMTLNAGQGGGTPVMHFQVNDSEKMRLTSSGYLLIGMTSSSTTTQGMMFRPGQESSIFRDSGYNLLVGGAQSGQRLIDFRHNGSSIGYITKSGTTGIAYNTSSDYRLKENAVAISDGITRLKTLKPYRFNFISDASTTVDGFFAHEVTAVPEAIIGTKDEVDSDNNPVYQGIDQSKLVPLLTAALQEAITKIETLETKVATLEGS